MYYFNKTLFISRKSNASVINPLITYSSSDSVMAFIGREPHS